MSERIVNDPSQHGWVEVDGKWMWGASGGSGGSIQDGDTEGQITTWDGTEWTPEDAVVVDADGNVGIGTDSPDSKLSVVGETNTPISIEATGASSSASTNYKTPSGEWFTGVDVGGTDGSYSIWSSAQPGRVLTIDADGNVYISGKLFVNGVEVGGGGFWVEETPGVIKYNGTAKATDLVAG